PLPAVSSSLPASLDEPSFAPLNLSVFERHARLHGLAPDGVCRAVAVTGDAVGSYPAVSPLPGEPRPARRSFLCCTFLGVSATGRYSASRSLELGLSSRLDARPFGRARNRRSPVRHRREKAWARRRFHASCPPSLRHRPGLPRQMLAFLLRLR